MADRMNAGWWGNLLGYQACWFVAVIAAGRGLWWPGVVASAAFILWQLSVLPDRTRSMRLLACAMLAGALIDGALALGGGVRYAADVPALPSGGAPLWILGLWGTFAMALRRSLAFLQGRPWLAAIFGAVGAPLAYLGAAGGWQAVSIQAPAWPAMLALAGGWALALPALAAVGRSRP